MSASELMAPGSQLPGSFDVAVLGGRFRVTELTPEAGDDTAEAAAVVRDMPCERWFVMAGEPEEEQPDALVMIDDDFRLVTFAYGRLQAE